MELCEAAAVARPVYVICTCLYMYAKYMLHVVSDCSCLSTHKPPWTCAEAAAVARLVYVICMCNK